jgi:FtsH-binding integral membrane protein
MSNELVESIQQAASGKAALAMGVAGITTPTWVDYIVSNSSFQAGLVLLGAIVSLTIIAVNIQSLIQRKKTNKEKYRQERIRTALLECQAKDKGIEI